MEIGTWLRKLAAGVGKPSEKVVQSTQEAAEQFLLKTLQLVRKSHGDPKQVYAVWAHQQEQFTVELLTVLPLVWAQLLTQESEQKSNIADTFISLANLLQEFSLGTHWLNLELAIQAYQLALQVKPREAFPQKWAMTQHNLGRAYTYRMRGEKADNIEKAIEAYHLALQVRTHEFSPQSWAITQRDLANAYIYRIQGEQEDNIKKAIETCQLVLRVFTRQAFPQDWALTQTTLAIAYDCLKGGRADNIEKAIEAYQMVLQIFTRETFPELWAIIQNALANDYIARIRGERADNLEKAIEAYQLALQVYTREAFPQDWAVTQGNLAGALIDRAELNNNLDDIDTAIRLLQEELVVAASGSNYFINDQHRLGSALFRRYEQRQQQADLELAVQVYETAFRSLGPENFNLPFYRERVGELQSMLGGLLVNEGKWRQGLEFLQSSLEFLQQTNNLPAHANALYQAGRAQELLSNIETAGVYYRDALRLYQHLDDQSGIARTRERLGSLLVGQGYLEPGIEHLKAAQRLYRELDQPEQAANLDELLKAAQTILEKQSDSIATP